MNEPYFKRERERERGGGEGELNNGNLSYNN